MRYSATALRSLGRNVVAVTRVAPHDDSVLLDEMRSLGVSVASLPSAQSTIFENSYEGPALAVRKQRVNGIADPFVPEDLTNLSVKIAQLGPLTSGEMSAEFIEAVAATGARVALDIQGYTRRIESGAVHQHRCDNTAALLRAVTYLKADDSEARTVTGLTDVRDAARALQRMGPREVLITFADRGSLVLDPRAVPSRAKAPCRGPDCRRHGLRRYVLCGVPAPPAGRTAAQHDRHTDGQLERRRRCCCGALCCCVVEH